MMKTRILTIAILLAGFMTAEKALGQGKLPVPENAKAISKKTVFKKGGEVAWVCSEDTLIIRGKKDTVFLERDAHLILRGNDALVFAKSGATVEVIGKNATVHYEEGVNIVHDNNRKATFIPKEEIAFDYNNAPIDGCLVTGIDESRGQGLSVKVIPNPLMRAASVTYAIGRSAQVELNVYDVTGTLVVTLVNGIKDAGIHSFVWHAGRLNIGTYVYELKVDGQQKYKKLIEVKGAKA